MSRVRSRNWCFTAWEELDWAGIVGDKCSYVIVGVEVCPDTGKTHYQGYAEFDRPMELAGLKKLFDNKTHFEIRRGTQQQAIKYCMKDGKFTEYGKKKEQGERKDLGEAREMAMNEGMRTVTAVCNYQQIKVAEKFLTYNEEPRNWVTKVIWIWGPSGAGKSKMAREICTEDVYVKNNGSKWWDGYDAHENVIIDDFRDSWWHITETLSLLDRYEKQVEVKGGFRQFKPKTLIITSIKSPESCYANTGESKQQILRRISQIIKLDLGTDMAQKSGVILDPDSRE